MVPRGPTASLVPKKGVWMDNRWAVIRKTEPRQYRIRGYVDTYQDTWQGSGFNVDLLLRHSVLTLKLNNC